MEVIDADILIAIRSAVRAIACERAARIEPDRAQLWGELARFQHTRKRRALALFEQARAVGAAREFGDWN